MARSPGAQEQSPVSQSLLDALIASVESLRQELHQLRQRIDRLEDASAPVPAICPAADSPTPSEETISVLSAAIAAYLGYRPRLRQVRLVGGGSWSVQGRVTIQASHTLNRLSGHGPSMDSR
jgi:hypothetical protein